MTGRGILYGWGDEIVSSITSAPILAAVVIAVLGAWVATITLEQAMFVKSEGGWWQMWLAVVSVSLGGVGVWCSMVMANTGLSLSKMDGEAPLPLDFSFSAAFLGLLPCFTLTWAGLMVSVGDFENQQDMAQGSVEVREQHRLRQKRAAVSVMAQVDLLKRSVSKRQLLGSALIASAVLLTRLPLMSMWVMAATSRTPPWAWAVTSLLDGVMIASALLFIMHAVRWKVLGVVMFASAVMQDWLIGTSSIRWYLASSVPSAPSALYELCVSATTVQLVAGIIACCICLIFIGLQFSRMKLSRNGLSALVASLEQVAKQLKEAVTKRDSQLMQQRQELNKLCRMLDCISLLSSHPTEYAYALSQASTYFTFQADWTASTTRGDITNASHAGQPPFIVKERQRTHAIKSRNQGEEPHMFTPSTASQDDGDGSRTVKPAPRSVLSRRSVQLSSIAPSPSCTSPEKAKLPANVHGSPESAEKEMHVELIAATSAARTSSLDVPVGFTPSHQRAGSISLDASSHQEVWKRYETEVCSLLEQQKLRRETDLTTNGEALQSTQNQSSGSHTEDSAGFSLTSSLLGRQSREVMLPADTPPLSLASLLSHPVCLELLKGELQQIHSVENLMFFVHVRRYKKLRRPGTLKSVARCIFDEFIRPGAPQEINISIRLREAIAQAVRKKGTNSCSADLFEGAEREVLQLMETNVMKAIQKSPVRRLCSWLLAAVPTRSLSGVLDAAHAVSDGVGRSRSSVEEGDLDVLL